MQEEHTTNKRRLQLKILKEIVFHRTSLYVFITSAKVDLGDYNMNTNQIQWFEIAVSGLLHRVTNLLSMTYHTVSIRLPVRFSPLPGKI